MNINTIVESIDFFGRTEPDRIAYQTSLTQHTFGELKKKSDALANDLEKKLKDKGPIVVFGNLEFEMIVTFLSAAKSGHAYLPIEEHTPNERIESILRVAKPSLIISVGKWETRTTNIPVISKEELLSIIDQEVLYEATKMVTGNENYYIIFTSGTTGEPKGVQISHDNLLSFVRWTIQDFKINEGRRFLAQAPFSFDLSVFSIYPCLVSGGILKPLEKAVIQDFKQLFPAIAKLLVDVWVSTPSFIEICLMEPTFDAIHAPELSMFLFCGEELTRKTAQELLKRFPKAKIYNTYGPTEATVAISSIQITQGVLDQYSRLPVGYAKNDTDILIYNNEEKASVNEIGEIIISGPSVSKGYLNNPQKTQEAFFTQNEQPSYRTGDTGYLNEEGLLFYEGRMDQQVKLHGYRIELGDIEHSLLLDERVKQAVVIPKYQEAKVQYLVAFIVLVKEVDQPSFRLSKSIKKELANSVMDYMIPQKINYVDFLPQTVNGKMDRKKLITEVNPQ